MAVCNRFLNLRRAQEASTDEYTSEAEGGAGAREEEALASRPPRFGDFNRSLRGWTVSWNMREFGLPEGFDREFFVKTEPPPRNGRACHPPRFKSAAEMQVWWSEWAIGLPGANGGDGPIAWRTRGAQESW